MDEQELLRESAENIVEVEDELRERKEKAMERAVQADEDEEADLSRRSLLLSPPVQGTSELRESSYGDDKIDIRFVDELPNGKSKVTVSVPSTSRVQDETHSFNRLLTYHGVDPERLADLNGCRIPLRPRGDYDNPESMSFDVDYPPVPTLPNRLLYRGRRACERLGLLRWGHTPYVERSITGRFQGYREKSSSGAESMPKAGYEFVRWLELLEEDAETVVPTDRGVAAFIGGSVASMLLLAVGAFASGSFLIGIPMLLLALGILFAVGPIAVIALHNWFSRGVKWAKRRFFPSA